MCAYFQAQAHFYCCPSFWKKNSFIQVVISDPKITTLTKIHRNTENACTNTPLNEKECLEKNCQKCFLNKLTFFSVNKMTQRCVNPRRMSKIFAKERRRDGKPSWESEKRSRMSSQGKEIFYTFFIHSFSKRKLPESEKEMKMNENELILNVSRSWTRYICLWQGWANFMVRVPN